MKLRKQLMTKLVRAAFVIRLFPSFGDPACGSGLVASMGIRCGPGMIGRWVHGFGAAPLNEYRWWSRA
ncbi:MAG: hypothetical protein ABI583_13065 [Betaproteobacteria bacterium]